MSPRSSSGTKPCSADEAKGRLADARAQLALAEAVTPHDGAERKAAAGCAVLAGIAAADAACCKALGQRNRSQNHRDAVDLLREVTPGGKDAANALTRLLGVKDQAHYGFADLSDTKLKAAIRQAQELVRFAEGVVRR